MLENFEKFVSSKIHFSIDSISSNPDQTLKNISFLEITLIHFVSNFCILPLTQTKPQTISKHPQTEKTIENNLKNQKSKHQKNESR